VTAAGLLLAAAVAGLAAGLVLLERTNREIDGQRRAAQTAQARAVAINKFLVEDLLRQADVQYNPGGGSVTVRQAMDRASARLDRPSAFAGQPLVEADLRMVIGHAYDGFEALEEAERHFRRARELRARELGPDHRDTLAAWNRQVHALAEMNRTDEAEREARAAAEACTRVLGEADEETGRALTFLGEILNRRKQFPEAEALLRRSAEILRSAGADSYWTLFAENSRAIALFHLNRCAEAEAVHRRMLAERLAERPPPKDYLVLVINRGLAADLLGQGKFRQSEPLLRESARDFGEVVGKKNDAYFMIRNNLGYALEGLGRYPDAEQEYLAVLAARRQTLPPTHTSISRTLAFLARLHARQGQWDRAADYLAELVRLRAADPRPGVDGLAKRLTAALAADAEPAAAEPLLRECHEAAKQSLWAGDWLTAELASRYGDCLRRQRKYTEAEPILAGAAHDVGKAIGVPPEAVLACRRRVAELYDALGNPAEAAKWGAPR
jgi:tetratricopeptide (TPR) repeat protein